MQRENNTNSNSRRTFPEDSQIIQEESVEATEEAQSQQFASHNESASSLMRDDGSLETLHNQFEHEELELMVRKNNFSTSASKNVVNSK